MANVTMFYYCGGWYCDGWYCGWVVGARPGQALHCSVGAPLNCLLCASNGGFLPRLQQPPPTLPPLIRPPLPPPPAGFAYLMLQRYLDAAKCFNFVLNQIAK